MSAYVPLEVVSMLARVAAFSAEWGQLMHASLEVVLIHRRGEDFQRGTVCSFAAAVVFLQNRAEVPSAENGMLVCRWMTTA